MTPVPCGSSAPGHPGGLRSGVGPSPAWRCDGSRGCPSVTLHVTITRLAPRRGTLDRRPDLWQAQHTVDGKRCSVLAALCAFLLIVAGCGAEVGEPQPSSGKTSGESGDLTWGEGAYGVVLAHGAAFDAASWEEQATQIADQGATVIAVEDIDTESIEAAVQRLRDEGIEDVALVGGSAGADSILELASAQPGLPDQLVLLSPNRTVEGLGEEPKLFIASTDEAAAEVSSELADSAPGDDNEALILPGSAHAQNIFDSDQADQALDALLERLAR